MSTESFGDHADKRPAAGDREPYDGDLQACVPPFVGDQAGVTPSVAEVKRSESEHGKHDCLTGSTRHDHDRRRLPFKCPPYDPIA